MSDNFRFDMTAVPLSLALPVAFHHHSKATGWVEAPLPQEHDRAKGGEWGANQSKRRLILLWTKATWAEEPVNYFPAPIEVEQAEGMIKAWLKEQDYGSQPDHDGDNGKGFRIYNEAWGHVAGRWEAFVAIEPVWLLYGK